MPRTLPLALLAGLAGIAGSFASCSSFTEDAATVDDAGTSDAPALLDASLDSSTAETSLDAARASTTYRDAVLADGPIAYWRMGNVDNGVSIRNEVDGGTALILQNIDDMTTGAPGALSSDPDPSILFHGKNGHAIASDATRFQFLTPEVFTIELWARSTAPDAGGEEYPTLFSTSEGFDQGTNGYLLYGVQTTKRAQYNYGPSTLTALTTMGTGWRHYAVTFDGTKSTLFIDGAMNVTKTADAGSAARVVRFAVGSNPAYGRYFSGAIDEVAIYDKALPFDRIAVHFGAR